MNEVQQAIFINRNSQKSGLTTSTDLKNQPLQRWVDTERYIKALGVLREGEIDAQAIANCSVVVGKNRYADLLHECSYFDYSSIMEEAVAVLRNNSGVRQRLAERVRDVTVDEYQDVNPIQEQIVRSLHELGARVCVVGDDDQTIYQWRGSNVQNILTFEQRYPSVHQIRLEENWRSSKGIVETARPFIEQNAERLTKQMKPTDAQTFESGDIVALSFKNPDEEADYIANTIKALRGVAIKEDNHERGISWSDVAILLRSVKNNGEPVTRALARASVPAIVVGMNNLFSTPEAEAARQLFYFMAARTDVDDAALERVWIAANVGVDTTQLRKAITAARILRDEFRASNLRNARFALQRVFLDFLEEAGVREERVPATPPGHGEIVLYNLGKFSQVISDFQQIHYHSKPVDLYEAFSSFLQFHAEDSYPEGWQNNTYANPDAVRVMTVHQAKGMQWPVVFVPALLKNRFPSKKQGGRSVWHLIPKTGVKDPDRYAGTIEDERRLFYVAMTRSQKFLHLTYAPVAGNQLFQTKSVFWDDILASKYVKRRVPDYSARSRLAPTTRTGVANVVFSFSDLKYLFECPYQFKLRILYGFNHPIHEQLGFGRSLHNVLADVHSRALHGEQIPEQAVEQLIATHLHLPFANPRMRDDLARSATNIVRNYIQDNQANFKNIEFFEKQVEISLGGGISVIGRIDLVRRIDTGETTIVDLKSNDRAQPEDVTETQLHIYALGYQELTGRRADYVQIYELDDRKPKTPVRGR